MKKGYQSFIEHTDSKLSKNKMSENAFFKTYQFSSDFGKGYTSIYDLDSYASICIAEHSYSQDFEYAIMSDEGVSIQQYDSIDSDRSYPNGDVYSGLQYIDYTPENEMQRYIIKKDTPAKVIGIQLMPEYYEVYLKKEFGVQGIDLKNVLQAFPKGINIPEISYIFNQIRNFKGNEISTKLFFKSKIDELTAIIIQKAEDLIHLSARVSQADRNTIIKIVGYITENLTKNFSLSDLATASYMSVSKFKYIFKAVTGQTFSEYLIQKRMEYACELLIHSNLYAAEIANLVGYKNEGSFSTQFKKYMGMLPREYRVSKIS